MENNEEKNTFDAEYTEKGKSEANVSSNYNENNNQSDNISSDDFTYSIVTYMTLIGFLVAICSVPSKDRSDYLKFHLNQSLVIHLFALLSAIPLIGWLWGIFVFIVWLIALIGACQTKMSKVVLFGDIHILN